MKPWDQNWEKIPNTETWTGGQGSSRCVQRKGNKTNEIFVLKILNRQRDSERRKRMYREVASLRTIDHKGVPKLIETNAEEYGTKSVNLYLVQEFVPGSTLDSYVNDKGPLNAKDALALFERLLKILDYCHEQEVYHRDLKPDNIVLRHDDPSDPVLIDFGQSFNLERDVESITPDEQHIGNRFLALPEYSALGSNRRDPRSDITVCCGLFYYTLTGEWPNVLINDQNQKPHQRPSSRNKLMTLQDVDIGNLFSLFDQAFDSHIDYRFQTIQALSQSLVDIKKSNSQVNYLSTSDRISRLKKKTLPVGQHERLKTAREALVQTEKQLRQVVNGLKKKLGDAFGIKQGGYSISIKELKLVNNLGFVHTLTEQEFYPRLILRIEGTEIVVTTNSNGPIQNLVRVPLSNPELNKKQCDLINEFYIEGLENNL